MQALALTLRKLGGSVVHEVRLRPVGVRALDAVVKAKCKM